MSPYSDPLLMVVIAFSAYFAGFCKGLIGLGEALIYVMGWNIAYLVFKACSDAKNPFDSYDVIVSIYVVVHIHSYN